MQCPGQDTRYWKPGAVFEAKCPHCGSEIEFFKDEVSRRCKKCGERMINPKLDFGCASYCKYAEQCLGVLPPELLAGREDLFKDRVAIAVKRYLGKDFRRVGHATRVARYAEQIGKQERGNLAVILSAAYLHSVGAKEAWEKYQSDEPRLQEIEAPAAAREILTNLGANPKLIDEVCDIISYVDAPGANENQNFKIYYDAKMLADLEESAKEHPLSPEELEGLLANRFLTPSGRELASQELAKHCRKPQASQS
ncbi:hypothetical protein [Desulfobacca acetoxidans]|uniref:HD domain-containing protein n=1 Tax=Desulfobacca acetoxidans (strain ATCC 700848 / DSM 11109 / ASRB2) TaxID=880072 RepID=F2NHI6_DESAR|nr:hypothetical protein [Desulfobacca acetoxidans]AEB09173.1 hypothetical protein Desac_1316 [Desulfobacca acetoxidans DSM 11109]HAY22806.1 phosphohydrolase [Desulfobacterales bacterium]